MEKTAEQGIPKMRRLAATAMLAATATILMYFEFPLPLMPPFLKFDLSGLVVLLTAFMFGPVQAVLVNLVKNMIHFFSSSSGGVGQLADFIILSGYAVTAGVIYMRKKDKKHALIGCCAATVVVGVLGVFANMFLLIPFYSKIMPIDAIIAACAAVNPMIGDLNAYYFFGALPFNLIKGAVLAALTIVCYKRLSVLIKGTTY